MRSKNKRFASVYAVSEVATDSSSGISSETASSEVQMYDAVPDKLKDSTSSLCEYASNVLYCACAIFAFALFVATLIGVLLAIL